MIRSFSVTLKLLPALLVCASTLGWRLGWRYWKIVRRAALRPELALEWARACRLNTIAQPEDAELFHKWADELENSYKEFMENSRPSELNWTRYDADYAEARPHVTCGYLVADAGGNKWQARVISGTAYKRVSTLTESDGESLEEAKARCEQHWEKTKSHEKTVA